MRLALWVKRSGWTVQELADVLGCHRVTLHRYMAGQLMPRRGMAGRIVGLTDGKVKESDLGR